MQPNCGTLLLPRAPGGDSGAPPQPRWPYRDNRWMYGCTEAPCLFPATEIFLCPQQRWIYAASVLHLFVNESSGVGILGSSAEKTPNVVLVPAYRPWPSASRNCVHSSSAFAWQNSHSMRRRNDFLVMVTSYAKDSLSNLLHSTHSRISGLCGHSK